MSESAITEAAEPAATPTSAPMSGAGVPPASAADLAPQPTAAPTSTASHPTAAMFREAVGPGSVQEASGFSSSAPPIDHATIDDATIITRRPPELPGVARSLLPSDLGRMLVGQSLNHFELLEYVGGGGMGAVFRARDTTLNRQVALKVLLRDQGNDEDTRRRFQNEAQSAARLDHENIARVFYVGADRGLNYIVFEFIEGQNVREVVEQRGSPLTIAEAISYTIQIAKALEHASSRDVVHRDIKPSNVLVTADGRAKLVDMGLARLHQVETHTDLTASGVTLGTFDYISPEQAFNPRTADVRSDIYSLGCTLYYMLTGRPPFPDGTVMQKMLRHNNDDPPDARQFNPEIPPGLASILRRMLAKNPRRRYQNPVELIDALLRVASTLGLPMGQWAVASVAPVGPMTALFLRHLPWIVPMAAMLVIVTLLEFWPTEPIPAPSIFAVPSTGAVDNATRNDGATEAALPSAAIDDSNRLATATVDTSANPAASNSPSRGMGGGNSGEPARSAGGADARDSQPSDSPLRPGLLVVSPSVRGSQYYASLRAACNAAKNGDVIELRYDGPREERPITVSNRRFTIRAGESHRPVVVFRPQDPDPVRYPRAMLTLHGGRLALVGVEIELHVPNQSDIPAEHWTLFDAELAESLDLQTSTLTIRNARELVTIHPKVTFFHARRALAGLTATAGDDLPEPIQIRLENCLLRGEATLLRIDDAQPVQLAWDNGLLATTESLLNVGGAEHVGRHERTVHAALRHVTAAIDGGLCRMTNDIERPYLPQVELDIADSILIAPSHTPLVDQEGVDDVETFRSYISWNGERVFYQGFDTAGLWRINDLNRADGAKLLGLADWEQRWGPQHEILPTWGDVSWRRPPVGTACHQRTAEDYALGDPAPDNMARSGASDGRDVGLLAYLLAR